MDRYELLPHALTIEDLEKLSQKPYDITLSSELEEKVLKNRRFLEENLKGKIEKFVKIYFPKTSTFLPPEEVRAVMISKVYSLSLGYSGVRLELIRKILEFLRKDIIPIVPEEKNEENIFKHIIYTLMGKGKVLYKGEKIETKRALKLSKTDLIIPQEEEYLAIISGNSFITGIGSLYYMRVKRLGKISEIAKALLWEALGVKEEYLDPWIYALRPHLGEIKFSENLRRLISNSEIIPLKSKERRENYLKNASHIFSVFHQIMDFLKDILEVELNSVSSRLLIIPEEKKTLSTENSKGYIIIKGFEYLSSSIMDIIRFSKNLIYKISGEKFYLPPIKGMGIKKLKKLIEILENLTVLELNYATYKIDSYRPLKCGTGTEIAYNFWKSLDSKSPKNLYILLQKVEEEVGELF